MFRIISLLLASLVLASLLLTSFLSTPEVSTQSNSLEVLPEEFGSSTLLLGERNFTAYHPPEFKLEVVNLDLIQPRIIHFHKDRMFIGSRSGEIYWMDPPYDTTHSLGRIKGYPHSIVIKDGFIYIALSGSILRAPYDWKTTNLTSENIQQYVKLPGRKGHKSRTLKTGPDDKLYVSVGITGNCSDEYLSNTYPIEKRRGGLFQLIDDSGMGTLVPYASGLRNPVGFDWHPSTGDLYATNNGPDHLGFENPPEYLAKLFQGSFHGMPWYQFVDGKIIRDSCIEREPPKMATEVSIPVATFPARNAPMDIAFIPKHAKLDNYFGDAIVALRGSWGTAGDGSADGDLTTRRPPKLVRVKFEDGNAIDVVDLVVGFQSPNSGSRWARPVGVAIGPNGDIYFTSDEGAQGLYRLSKIK